MLAAYFLIVELRLGKRSKRLGFSGFDGPKNGMRECEELETILLHIDDSG